MGLAVIGFGTSQKKESSAPFTAGSAHNGTSIDTAGKVVLGNDLGDPLAPAALTNTREIPLSTPASLGSSTVVLTDVLNGVDVTIGNGGISISETLGLTSAGMSINSSGGAGSNFLMIAGLDAFLIRAQGFGTIDGLVGALQFLSVEVATGRTQLGENNITTFNGSTLQVSGTITGRRLVSGAAGAVAINRDLDSGKVFFNTAASTLTMPNMVGFNLRAGFTIGLTCLNAGGITLQLLAGQTLRFGATATSSGGTLSSVVVGSFARVTLIDAATLITESFNGTWVLT